MATVTGLTAERMQEIIDMTIVDANVVGNNLILTLHDGSTVDTGNVRGPTGATGATGAPGTNGAAGLTVCTSTTRPSSPTNGMQIFETDTFKTLHYYSAKGGWFPPWNQPWGLLGKHKLTTNSVTFTSDANTDMAITGISFRNDRHYQFGFDGEADLDGAGVWTGEITVNGTAIGRVFQLNVASANGDYFSGSCLWIPASNGTWTVRLYASEYSGAATFSMAASSTVPRQLWVRDVGPAV